MIYYTYRYPSVSRLALGRPATHSVSASNMVRDANLWKRTQMCIQTFKKYHAHRSAVGCLSAGQITGVGANNFVVLLSLRFQPACSSKAPPGWPTRRVLFLSSTTYGLSVFCTMSLCGCACKCADFVSERPRQ
jgi:hypothetical protein